MQRIFIFITFLFITACTYCSGQTGIYHFNTVEGDSCRRAQITVGWDYIRVTTYDYSTEVEKSFSVAYASSPDYNFSLSDGGSFWISRKSIALKFLGKFNIKKNKFTYIRLNGVAYR